MLQPCSLWAPPRGADVYRHAGCSSAMWKRSEWLVTSWGGLQLGLREGGAASVLQYQLASVGTGGWTWRLRFDVYFDGATSALGRLAFLLVSSFQTWEVGLNPIPPLCLREVTSSHTFLAAQRFDSLSSSGWL